MKKTLLYIPLIGLLCIHLVANSQELPRSEKDTGKVQLLSTHQAKKNKPIRRDTLSPIGPRTQVTIGHFQAVTCVDYQPREGKLMVSGSIDKTLKLRDGYTGEEIKTLAGHPESVTAVCFSPDGKYFASGDGRHGFNLNIKRRIGMGNIIMWQAKTGKSINTGESNMIISEKKSDTLAEFVKDTIYILKSVIEGKITAMTFSPDGKFLALGGWKQVKVYEWNAKQEKLHIKDSIKVERGQVNALSFSQDNHTLVYGIGKKIHFWNLKDNKDRAKPLAKHRIDKLFYTQNGKYLIVAGKKRNWFSFLFTTRARIHILDAISGKEVKKFKIGYGKVQGLVGTRDGSLLACWTDEQPHINIYNTQNQELVQILQAGIVNDIAFHPNGNYLVTANGNKTLKIWNIESGKIIKYLLGDVTAITSLATSPTADIFATGTLHGHINIWNANTGEIITSLVGHTDAVQTLDFRKDGNYLVSGGDDNRVFLWKLKDPEIDESYDRILLNEEDAPVKAVKFSQDNLKVYVGGEGNAGKVFKVFKKPLVFNQNANRNTSTSELRIIPSERKFFRKPLLAKLLGRPINHIERMPNSNKMIIGFGFISLADRKNIINTLASPVMLPSITFPVKLQVSLKKSYKENQSVTAIAAKDSNTFATSEGFLHLLSDKNKYRNKKLGGYLIKLWNVNNKIPIDTLEGHNVPIEELCFSPNKRFLASGDKKGLIKIWDLERDTLYKELIGHYDGITNLEFERSGNYLVSTSKDGAIKRWDINKGQEYLTSYALPRSSEFISITNDNYFIASLLAGRKVRYLLNHRVFSYEQFNIIYNRPDLVLSKIDSSAKKTIRKLFYEYLAKLKRMNLEPKQLQAWINSESVLPEVSIPVLSFINHPGFEEKKDRNFTLHISITDSKTQLASFHLYVNGVPIFGRNGLNLTDKNTLKYEEKLQIKLSQGLNIIDAVALNQNGIGSLRQKIEVQYNATEYKPKLYLLTIGISNYERSEMNLDLAAKDAIDLVNFYRRPQQKAFSKIISRELIDEDAIYENILDAKSFLRKAGVDDQIIVLFSGHGLVHETDSTREFYYATHDIDPENPELRGIPYSQIEDLLDSIPCRKKLLLLDACYSGELFLDRQDLRDIVVKVTKHSRVKIPNPILEIFKKEEKIAPHIWKGKKRGRVVEFTRIMKAKFNNLRMGTGTNVISSSTGQQASIGRIKKVRMLEGLNNSLFTGVYLLGLGSRKVKIPYIRGKLNMSSADLNKDGKIMLSEMKYFLEAQVYSLSQENQIPTTRAFNPINDFRLW